MFELKNVHLFKSLKFIMNHLCDKITFKYNTEIIVDESIKPIVAKHIFYYNSCLNFFFKIIKMIINQKHSFE